MRQVPPPLEAVPQLRGHGAGVSGDTVEVVGSEVVGLEVPGLKVVETEIGGLEVVGLKVVGTVAGCGVDGAGEVRLVIGAAVGGADVE